jgi:acetyl/propionyl-CoA carboxylase alpha subunit
MIRKLLVANRGEIAIRVIQAAQEMGIRTVAVYSDADAHLPHALMADEAVCIGEPEPVRSYLEIARVIAAATETGADAIHPGYGFLSERVEFAEACAEAGIVFVGPPPEASRRLGAKIGAKELAEAAGVPVAPGLFRAGATDAELRAAAERIGYPVMLKASAGGGGRGMRVVRDPASFEASLEAASGEALRAFGDGTMMVEKLVENPRHIEVQVLADQHGHVAALYERECSVQRRHQKLIEEAPAPGMTEELWAAMRAASVSLALAAGYQGAGTVEFMVDPASGAFHFLEVNARLQVEHPVTEEVCGVDLVQWQLRIANGEPLAGDARLSRLMSGDRRELCGHAIEARIVAEDPSRGFMPSSGRILTWVEPKRPGVRVDSGYGPGLEVSRFYDSLMAKVIAHAESRDGTIRRLCAALRDFHIIGVPTNIPFLLDVLDHPDFRAGKVDTGFLPRSFAGWSLPQVSPPELGALVRAAGPEAVAPGDRQAGRTAWTLGDQWRVARG